MDPYIEIKPAPFCLINPTEEAEEYIDLHIDNYNRIYIRYKHSKKLKDQYFPLKCEVCNHQVSYFPNSIGITCTDSYCHKQTMLLSEHKQRYNNNKDNKK